MKKKSTFLLILALFTIPIFFYSCDDDDDDDQEPYGKINFIFEHYLDNQPVEFDNMQYQNAAGNNYEVSEIQWFITDVTLNKSNGASTLLDAWTFYHYIDTDIPSTMEWALEDKISPGDYSSITFTLGIKGEKNIPMMFVNYPESAMFWPLHLGGDNGGYHYLKLNGFWKDVNDFRRGFQFHLGVGQEQYSDGTRVQVWDEEYSDSSYVFVQNWFEVTLDNSALSIKDNVTTNVTLRMNIEQWFTNPNDYDFDHFGSETMENQRALQTMKENGANVFSVTKIE